MKYVVVPQNNGHELICTLQSPGGGAARVPEKLVRGSVTLIFT